MTRRLTALALALVLALSLTGCWEAEPEPDDFWNDDPSSPSEEEPQREPAQISDFTLPYLSGQTFDPVTCIDGVQQTVGALLYEPLFTLDASFFDQCISLLFLCTNIDDGHSWVLHTHNIFHINGTHLCKLYQMRRSGIHIGTAVDQQ